MIRVHHNLLEVCKKQRNREGPRKKSSKRLLNVAGRPASVPSLLRDSLKIYYKSIFIDVLLILPQNLIFFFGYNFLNLLKEGKTEEETKEYRFTLHSQFSFETMDI